MSHRHPLCVPRLALALLLALLPLSALGLTPTPSGMPWDEPAIKIMDSITGPIASVAVLMGIALGAGTWALSNDNRGLMRVGKGIAAGIIVGGLTALFGALGIEACVV